LKKTERCPKGERVIPLWPELRTELNTLFAIVQPGVRVPLDSFVVQKYRSTENNLRTQLGRIADADAVEKWPKPFMALRATRRTELERAGFKNHVLNEWFGHSGAIAQEHYLQVTESDFEQATGTLGQPSGSVDPLVDPSQGKQGPPRSITQTQKPNKKRALMALATVLMFLKIHPKQRFS
jgi:hypothetical protein